ncbi:hypothetical protein MMPV_009874 [Pyropia vietnamensis]
MARRSLDMPARRPAGGRRSLDLSRFAKASSKGGGPPHPGRRPKWGGGGSDGGSGGGGKQGAARDTPIRRSSLRSKASSSGGSVGGDSSGFSIGFGGRRGFGSSASLGPAGDWGSDDGSDGWDSFAARSPRRSLGGGGGGSSSGSSRRLSLHNLMGRSDRGEGGAAGWEGVAGGGRRSLGGAPNRSGGSTGGGLGGSMRDLKRFMSGGSGGGAVGRRASLDGLRRPLGGGPVPGGSGPDGLDLSGEDQDGSTLARWLRRRAGEDPSGGAGGGAGGDTPAFVRPLPRRPSAIMAKPVEFPPVTLTPYPSDWATDVVAFLHNALRREMADLYALLDAMQRKQAVLTLDHITTFYIWWAPFHRFFLAALAAEAAEVFPPLAERAPITHQRVRDSSRMLAAERLRRGLAAVAAYATAFTPTRPAGEMLSGLLAAVDELSWVHGYWAAMEAAVPPLLAAHFRKRDKVAWERRIAAHVRRGAGLSSGTGGAADNGAPPLPAAAREAETQLHMALLGRPLGTAAETIWKLGALRSALASGAGLLQVGLRGDRRCAGGAIGAALAVSSERRHALEASKTSAAELCGLPSPGEAVRAAAASDAATAAAAAAATATTAAPPAAPAEPPVEVAPAAAVGSTDAVTSSTRPPTGSGGGDVSPPPAAPPPVTSPPSRGSAPTMPGSTTPPPRPPRSPASRPGGSGRPTSLRSHSPGGGGARRGSPPQGAGGSAGATRPPTPVPATAMASAAAAVATSASASAAGNGGTIPPPPPRRLRASGTSGGSSTGSRRRQRPAGTPPVAAATGTTGVSAGSPSTPPYHRSTEAIATTPADAAAMPLLPRTATAGLGAPASPPAPSPPRPTTDGYRVMQNSSRV